MTKGKCWYYPTGLCAVVVISQTKALDMAGQSHYWLICFSLACHRIPASHLFGCLFVHLFANVVSLSICLPMSTLAVKLQLEPQCSYLESLFFILHAQLVKEYDLDLLYSGRHDTILHRAVLLLFFLHRVFINTWKMSTINGHISSSSYILMRRDQTTTQH